MKLETQVQNVRKSGNLGETKKFSAEMNAKAFHILSDKLYTDKILAIVRELSTNAYEAHVMNGNQSEPFHVHLPTRMDDQFWIRDYGIGLTPEEIHNIYTVYFKSTKTDTDDVGGCFGLGSKSPLSYTHNFIVTSYKDGKQHIYSCHYNEEKIPCITEMGISDTDEPNGLKVQFTVREKDHYYFEEVAKKVYPYFETTPQINTTITPVEYSTKFPKWGLKKHNKDSRVVMGNINYPFPTRNFLTSIAGKGIDAGDLDRIYNVLSKHGIDLFFEIGELEVGVSREHIEETSKNAIAIYELAKGICEELGKEVKEVLDKIDNYHELHTTYSQLDSLSYNMVSPYLFKGVRKLERDDYGQFNSVGLTASVYDTYNVNRMQRSHRTNLKFGPNAAVFEKDCGNADKRIRSKYRNDSSFRPQILQDVEFESLYNKLETLYTYGVEPDAIPPASGLPKPQASRGSRGSFVPVVKYTGIHTLADAWEKSDTKLKDVKVYVEITANKFRHDINGSWQHPAGIDNFLRPFIQAGVDRPTIYGIKTSAYKKALEEIKEDGLNAVHLFTWAKEQLKKLEKQYPTQEFADLSGVQDQVSMMSHSSYMRKLSNILGHLDHNNDLLKRIDTYVNAATSKLHEHRGFHAAYLNINKKSIKIPKGNNTAAADIKLAKSKYPLLEHVNCNDKHFSFKSVADYINLMEK